MKNIFHIGISAFFFCTAFSGSYLLAKTTFSEISCDPCTPSTVKGNGGNLFSVNKPNDYDTCAQLFKWKYYHAAPDDSLGARKQFDSLKIYVERCAASDSQSFRVFNGLDGAVGTYTRDTMRYINYRTWLLSVLYLNPMSEYYCNCLSSIAGTFRFGKYNSTASALAVLDFIRHIKECWNAGLDKEYSKDSLDLHMSTTDTSIPTLEQLDLGILRIHGAVGAGKSISSIYLGSCISSPNPFLKETTLEFKLNRMAYTTIAVYDLLGRLVWGDGRGSSLEAGKHVIYFDGKDLPHGTLYARISTGFGEVKTVKLIHE
jgi:hypothetical protein